MRTAPSGRPRCRSAATSVDLMRSDAVGQTREVEVIIGQGVNAVVRSRQRRADRAGYRPPQPHRRHRTPPTAQPSPRANWHALPIAPQRRRDHPAGAEHHPRRLALRRPALRFGGGGRFGKRVLHQRFACHQPADPAGRIRTAIRRDRPGTDPDRRLRRRIRPFGRWRGQHHHQERYQQLGSRRAWLASTPNRLRANAKEQLLREHRRATR